MSDSTNLYTLYEEIKNQDYVLATYYMVLPRGEDVLAKAQKMAVGQTVGTWVEVPGITQEMRERHMGKVVSVLDAPPYELEPQIDEEMLRYFITIAYPFVNFGRQFPMLFTTLLGNDASTSAQAKLVNVQFPESFVRGFAGPKAGIEGLRELTGVKEGPLTLNMIKPCTGLSPQQGAKIFYETALGGIDFIKDDELLGNASFSQAAERVREFNKASDAAYERTGKHTVYVCHVTDDAARQEDTIKAVMDAGARMIMLCFSTVGYSMFQKIAAEVDVPVLGHYAASGATCEALLSGYSSQIAVGRFSRMAGSDMTMINTPYGGYPLLRHRYLMTAHELTLPFYHLKPSMPILGGGVHPGMTERFIREVGSDIVLASGGAIQGHPMGAAAGVRALNQSIEAAMKGIPAREYAKDHQELQVALDTFDH